MYPLIRISPLAMLLLLVGCEHTTPQPVTSIDLSPVTLLLAADDCHIGGEPGWGTLAGQWHHDKMLARRWVRAFDESKTTAGAEIGGIDWVKLGEGPWYKSNSATIAPWRMAEVSRTVRMGNSWLSDCGPPPGEQSQWTVPEGEAIVVRQAFEGPLRFHWGKSVDASGDDIVHSSLAPARIEITYVGPGLKGAAKQEAWEDHLGACYQGNEQLLEDSWPVCVELDVEMYHRFPTAEPQTFSGSWLASATESSSGLKLQGLERLDLRGTIPAVNVSPASVHVFEPTRFFTGSTMPYPEMGGNPLHPARLCFSAIVNPGSQPVDNVVLALEVMGHGIREFYTADYDPLSGLATIVVPMEQQLGIMTDVAPEYYTNPNIRWYWGLEPAGEFTETAWHVKATVPASGSVQVPQWVSTDNCVTNSDFLPLGDPVGT